MLSDYQKTLANSFKILTLLFLVLMCKYHMSSPEGSGDESLFISDLNMVKSQGWIPAIEKSIALTYLVLAYPFSYILPTYLALRLTNVLILGLLFVYFYKFGAIKNKLFYFYFLFLCSFGFFLAGTNDNLFIVSMLVYFNEVYKALENKKANIPLLWSMLLIAFFTRELVYIYLPLVPFSIYLMRKKKVNLLDRWYIPTSVLLFLVVINLPSLQKNHRLSYDDKKPGPGIESTWAQRQYLAQLMVNQGTLANLNHPTWTQTDAYLKEHGPNSLPKTTGAGIFFDLKLTFLEFFKDFAYCLFVSIRQTGFMLISVFIYLLYSIYQKRNWSDLFVPISSLFVISVFSFIIISYVEPRWIMVAFLLGILYYSHLEQEKKLPKILLVANHFVLILIIFYGSYKAFLKL